MTITRKYTHTHTQTGCNDNTEHEAAIIIYV